MPPTQRGCRIAGYGGVDVQICFGFSDFRIKKIILPEASEASGGFRRPSGGFRRLWAPGDPGSSPGRSQGGAKIMDLRPFRRPFWRPFWRPPVNRMAPKTWIFRGFGGLFWSCFWSPFWSSKMADMRLRFKISDQKGGGVGQWAALYSFAVVKLLSSRG